MMRKMDGYWKIWWENRDGGARLRRKQHPFPKYRIARALSCAVFAETWQQATAHLSMTWAR